MTKKTPAVAVVTVEGSAEDMEHSRDCLTKALIDFALEYGDQRVCLIAIALERILLGALH